MCIEDWIIICNTNRTPFRILQLFCVTSERWTIFAPVDGQLHICIGIFVDLWIVVVIVFWDILIIDNSLKFLYKVWFITNDLSPRFKIWFYTLGLDYLFIATSSNYCIE